MRRPDLGEIFVRHPVNGKSKRSQKQRAAPKEAAHEQNTETESKSWSYKEKDDDLQRHLDLMRNVVPLVHFAEEPGERTEEKSGAAPESRRNREYRNGR